MNFVCPSHTSRKGDVMAVKKELVDELLKDADPKKVFGSEGLLDEIKKALAERMLNAELDEHLAAQSAEADCAAGAGNHRNGYSKKTVLTDTGKLELDIPRDRRGSFEPQLIAKYQRRFPGFDEKIVDVRPRDERPGDPGPPSRALRDRSFAPAGEHGYRRGARRGSQVAIPAAGSGVAIVFFDALRVKIRDEGTVRNKAVYLAVAVLPEGKKDVLGLWIEQTEGAKFWLRVMTELKNRGVADVLITVVDGLEGFPEAISVVFPQAQVQTCIVHLIRYSMEFASWKERKAVAGALRTIYRAETAHAAQLALELLRAGLGVGAIRRSARPGDATGSR